LARSERSQWPLLARAMLRDHRAMIAIDIRRVMQLVA
jgi:hypothetical protein